MASAPAAARGRTLPGRLRPADRRPCRALRRHRRRRRARGGGTLQARRRVPEESTPTPRWRSRPPKRRRTLHQRLRADLGFPDPPEMTNARTPGGEVPGQALLLRLSRPARTWPASASSSRALEPADIGVELTEGDMMDPGSHGLGAGVPPPRRALTSGCSLGGRLMPAARRLACG